MDISQTAPPSPEAILAGIGIVDRRTIATHLALIEAADGVSVMFGAIQNLGERLNLIDSDAAAKHHERVEVVIASPASDDELRHRLWTALADCLAVAGPTPFSRNSARKAASALAVRTSERLSPAVRKAMELERQKNDPNAKGARWNKKLGRQVGELWHDPMALFQSAPPLPFPTIVAQEILALMDKPERMGFTDADAATHDPKMAEAMKGAHRKAQEALAGGGGWVAFAAVVANAGFTPYTLAAQLSAWIPFVGGPALVSLLAVLVNPLTLFAGLGAIAWLGTAQIGATVRSAIAARICILLALTGYRNPELGITEFVDAMRRLANAPEPALAQLPSPKRRVFRQRAAFIKRQLGHCMGETAGPPPPPWQMRAKTSGLDVPDALIAGVLTAGEMYWHAVAIDPDVISAADFCRVADLGDPISFAANAQMFASDAAGYSLRGYTAERLVMDRLVADGHAVSLAPESNTAGFDLIVDGSPVQVKCGEELSNLTEHFEKYPDIPVIANAELAKLARDNDADWSDLVSTVPGFDLAGIENDIADALGHAVSLADPDIVALALELGVLRGGIEVWRGRILLTDLPVWMAMNAGAKGILAFAGGKAGGLVGLVAAGPAGALIFGPAVACAAILGARPLQDRATKLILREWHHEFLALTNDLHTELRIATEQRIEHLKLRSEDIGKRTVRDTSGFGPWLSRRADDDLVAAIEDLEGLTDLRASEHDAPTLLALAGLLAPGSIPVGRAKRRLERHIQHRPGLLGAVGEQAKGWRKSLRPNAP